MLNTSHVTPFLDNTREFQANTVSFFSEALSKWNELQVMRQQLESGLASELIRLSEVEQIRLLERSLTIFKQVIQPQGLPYRELFFYKYEPDCTDLPEGEFDSIEILEDSWNLGRDLMRQFEYYQTYKHDFHLGIGSDPEDITLDEEEGHELIRHMVFSTHALAQEAIRKEYAGIVGEEKALKWIGNVHQRLRVMRFQDDQPEPSLSEVAEYYTTGIDPLSKGIAPLSATLATDVNNDPTKDKQMLIPRRRVVLLHFFRGDLGEAINSPTVAANLMRRYGAESPNLDKTAANVVKDWSDEDCILRTSATQVVNQLLKDIEYIKRYLNHEQQITADRYIGKLEKNRRKS